MRRVEPVQVQRGEEERKSKGEKKGRQGVAQRKDDGLFSIGKGEKDREGEHKVGE